MSLPAATPYRPDIDGLRALAIVPVVLFHLGVPGFMGGFVGVDIFFVISGFLITRILQDELDSGSFRFSHFWLRRARRLLPTLATVLAFTVGAGALILEGEGFRRLGRQAVAVSAFLGNVWTLRNAGGYWGPEADDFHLLHGWSLAVEEQFYLLFPLLLVLLNRRSRHPDRWLVALALVSLATTLPGPWRNASATFYLLHGRAWELLVGVLLARFTRSRPGFPGNPINGNWLGGLGAALVFVGFCLARPGPLFPGPLALLPTLGAALCIAAGPDSTFNRWLATPVPVYLGRLSYAWYLWHWPILVFLRAFSIDATLPTFLGSLALASLTYHGLERPARTLPVQRVPLRLILPAALVLGMAILTPRFLRHPVERLAPPLRWCDTDLMPNPSPEKLACTPSGLVRSPLGPSVPAPPIAPGPLHVLLIGDSHGRSLLPALDAVCRDLKWNHAAFTASGARPFLMAPGESWTNYAGPIWSESKRLELDATIRSFLNATSPPIIVVVARWNTLASRGKQSVLGNVQYLRERSPTSAFLFVGQPPQLPVGIGGFLSGELEFAPLTPFQEPHRARLARHRVHAWLRDFAATDPAARFLDISQPYLEGSRVRLRQGSTLLYFDDDHLSIAGANLAQPLLKDALLGLARSSRHPVPLPLP